MQNDTIFLQQFGWLFDTRNIYYLFNGIESVMSKHNVDYFKTPREGKIMNDVKGRVQQKNFKRMKKNPKYPEFYFSFEAE